MSFKKCKIGTLKTIVLLMEGEKSCYRENEETEHLKQRMFLAEHSSLDLSMARVVI